MPITTLAKVIGETPQAGFTLLAGVLCPIDLGQALSEYPGVPGTTVRELLLWQILHCYLLYTIKHFQNLLEIIMQFKNTRLSGIFSVILVWTLIWAMPGVFIEFLDNIAPSAYSFTRRIDMWIQTFAFPGILSGMLFLGLCGIAYRQHQLELLSAHRACTIGAVSGFLIGVLCIWLLLGWRPGDSLFAAASVSLITTLLGAIAGLGSVKMLKYRTHASAQASA
ncbi:MAG: hypothetical protein CMQ46_03375 [Gammaproteobacteria bacterium]|nr:hypothetical protein [Gammaproteobacteria bacterium]MBJ54289.1 hypothetical protein [Gammaproteobacteria bacterium]HBN16282.1 hypothetical protein [Pseudohongiella sp.]|tara:strand:- start:469 stop:1137 length:669 start_codon:yes stop_codon:yes gene_type:complete